MKNKIQGVLLMANISIYDFCQTIADFETGDEFIHFIRRKKRNLRMQTLELFRLILKKSGATYMFEKLRSDPLCSLNKQMVLYQLKGMSKDDIEKYAKEYYKSIIVPHLIPQMIELIREQKKDGYTIVVVSASYRPFLLLFKEEFKIDVLITNDFVYKDGFFTGKIAREDCIGKNKVKYFTEVYSGFDCKDYENCKSYGDSESDKYILNIAKEGFVIARTGPKKWVKKTNFEEILM